MPKIFNLALIKRFTDYFKLKVTDSLDADSSKIIVATVNLPLPVNLLRVIDIETNDSNKLIIVPDGKQWKILYGIITLVTTATAGSRRMNFRILEGTVELHRVQAVNAQIASTTERYSIGQYGDSLEAVAGLHYLPIPLNMILNPGFSIRIQDSNSIDAAADDLTIQIVVEETDITGE